MPISAGKFAVQEGHRIVGAGVMVVSVCLIPRHVYAVVPTVCSSGLVTYGFKDGIID